MEKPMDDMRRGKDIEGVLERRKNGNA